MMKLAKDRSSLFLHLFFICVIFANFAFWTCSKDVLPKWDNVPKPPTMDVAAFVGLGDKEVSYRLYGYMLQNFGNTGGNFMSLKKYDYASLKEWFELTRGLDARADYVPFMAAYFFGAIEDDAARLRYVIDYLAEEGAAPYPEKWRWLAQATYLARYKMNDMNLALELANKVAALPGYVAPWARQLPAFVELKMGNKQAAYEIMMRMLATDGEKLHPNEVNEMIKFICERALEKKDAAKNPLCQNKK